MELGFTDAPITKTVDESLGMSDYVSALSKFVLECQTPLTISIQGDWGSGKTSMMNMIKETLEYDDKKVRTIWFNTWQFSQFDMQSELSISLLTSFLDDLGESGKSAKQRVLGLATKGVKAALLPTLRMTGIDDSVVKDILNGFQNGSDDPAKQVKKMRGDIEKSVIDELEKSKADRLIVFVDDLDRLMPDRAVEILETIKLFLDIPKTVFILAVDYHVVAKGLEKKFGVSMNELKGKSFFDKIIQLPFNLPVAQYNTRKYLQKLFGSQSLDKDDLDIYIRLLEYSFGSNPRSMKRLINSLQLLKMVASGKGILEGDKTATQEEKQRILFAMLCLQTSYQPLYLLMLKLEDQIGEQLFQTFMDMDKLKDSKYFDEIVSMFGIEADRRKADLDTKINRLCNFMGAMFESIQLKSDTDEDAEDKLNDEELVNFKRFLSFSSLTSSSTGGIEFKGDEPYRAELNRYIQETLLPKYKEQMESMHSKFEIRHGNEEFSVYFKFSIGRGIGFNVVAWCGIEEKGRIRIYLNDIGLYGDLRSQAIKFFKLNSRDDFKELKWAKNLRTKWAYLEFLEVSGANNSSSTSELMERYQHTTEEAFNLIIPKLLDFYSIKEPKVSRVWDFIDKLSMRLIDLFPKEDGWIIEQPKNLDKYAALCVFKESWGDTVKLAIEANGVHFNGLYLGINYKEWKKNISDSQGKSLRDECNLNWSNGKTSDGWFFWVWVDKKYSNTIHGNIVDDDFCYAYENTDRENMALEYFVTEMGKLTTMEHKIQELLN